jgi:hypothetical protein
VRDCGTVKNQEARDEIKAAQKCHVDSNEAPNDEKHCAMESRRARTFRDEVSVDHDGADPDKGNNDDVVLFHEHR